MNIRSIYQVYGKSKHIKLINSLGEHFFIYIKYSFLSALPLREEFEGLWLEEELENFIKKNSSHIKTLGYLPYHSL